MSRHMNKTKSQAADGEDACEPDPTVGEHALGETREALECAEGEARARAQRRETLGVVHNCGNAGDMCP